MSAFAGAVASGVSLGPVSAAARGSRVAVAWTTGPEIHARIADAGAWGPDRLVDGIVADSQPEAEHDEVLAKSASAVQALELAEAGL